MKYPCEIIRDLLPLYIDNVASEESMKGVESHIAECEECKTYYQSINMNENMNSEDKTTETAMEESLKKVKSRINNRIRLITITSASAALMLFIGFYLLFDAPIHNLSKDDISVKAENYLMSEIATEIPGEEGKAMISTGETDEGRAYSLEIPSMPQLDITVTEEIMNRKKFVSIVHMTSPYYIKRFETTDGADENTFYVKAFKTTILNNKIIKGTCSSSYNVNFKKIDRIVLLTGPLR